MYIQFSVRVLAELNPSTKNTTARTPTEIMARRQSDRICIPGKLHPFDLGSSVRAEVKQDTLKKLVCRALLGFAFCFFLKRNRNEIALIPPASRRNVRSFPTLPCPARSCNSFTTTRKSWTPHFKVCAGSIAVRPRLHQFKKNAGFAQRGHVTKMIPVRLEFEPSCPVLVTLFPQQAPAHLVFFSVSLSASLYPNPCNPAMKMITRRGNRHIGSVAVGPHLPQLLHETNKAGAGVTSTAPYYRFFFSRRRTTQTKPRICAPTQTEVIIAAVGPCPIKLQLKSDAAHPFDSSENERRLAPGKLAIVKISMPTNLLMGPQEFWWYRAPRQIFMMAETSGFFGLVWFPPKLCLSTRDDLLQTKSVLTFNSTRHVLKLVTRLEGASRNQGGCRRGAFGEYEHGSTAALSLFAAYRGPDVAGQSGCRKARSAHEKLEEAESCAQIQLSACYLEPAA
ncbi:hypothetical protein C8R45DRAFT_931922 [Mycena sanguinolenta]|nr:hypothetical protein C8R45DRAFT_931922 [Mycena sanguinolenta]